jgi:hypothetical protein
LQIWDSVVVLSKLGTTPYPGFRPGVQPHLGAADRPGQAWVGLWASVCPRRPRFFFLPHIPCDTTSHGRTPRPVPPQLFIFGPHIFYGQKKKMPHAPQISPRVSHIFCKIRWQKRGLGEIFLIFANASPAARPGVACSTTLQSLYHAALQPPHSRWSGMLASYALRHRFARRHATAGSAARLFNSGRPGPERTLE